MVRRTRKIGLGNVIIELDDSRRLARLVGNLAWLSLPRDSRIYWGPPATSSAPWEASSWGEVVCDCDCEDCQAQRAVLAN